MAKICALFSGQGSQYPGMGKELYDNFPKVREIYECAGDLLGLDVAGLSFEGTEEELSQTLVAQPLIYTHSLACRAAASDLLGEVYAVAGHSLGEFAALACAGAYSVEDGFRIIKARAQAMDEVARQVSGAMYAIVGSSEDAVKAACEQTGGFVLPVNFNLPNQTVISGEPEPTQQAADLLTEQGAKAVRLAVSSAFHTSMMEPAAKLLESATQSISFSACRTAFYSNLTGSLLALGPEEYPGYFAKHMVSPVLFVQQMQALATDGVDTCVEFGPKKTAATLAKKNVKSFHVCNIEDLKTLEKARQML